MKIVWTAESLVDLEEILAYYYREAGPRTASAVERRIISQVEGLRIFPERTRKSDRIPGTHELVLNKLPYIAFLHLRVDVILVLNVVHTARKFPG